MKTEKKKKNEAKRKRSEGVRQNRNKQNGGKNTRADQ